jgi:two-component system nitrate/nitrite response regulator NarL
VIARADSDDVETASDFLGLGVTSVIPREITPDGFVSSLEAATAGVRIVPRWLQVQAVHRPQPLLRSLTPEERRLWSALSLGSTNESIARQLFVSERTLTRMTRELFRKLQVANRVGAATLAGRVGLPNTCDLVDPSETGLPHIRSVS